METPRTFTEEEIRELIREETGIVQGVDRNIFNKKIQIMNGRNIQAGRSIGTKIGTANDQRLGFFGATPVLQQTKAGHNNWVNLSDLMSALVNLGLIDVGGDAGIIEYDNGNITGTATINWANGNVQYATMTGNVTLTFTNPVAGRRYILHLAGAFTPTFPSTVRWTGGTTPGVTATAGKKDIYTLVYSGKESLYNILQSLNYAIT